MCCRVGAVGHDVVTCSLIEFKYSLKKEIFKLSLKEKNSQ